jgi:hypothetical protein
METRQLVAYIQNLFHCAVLHDGNVNVGMNGVIVDLFPHVMDGSHSSLDFLQPQVSI